MYSVETWTCILHTMDIHYQESSEVFTVGSLEMWLEPASQKPDSDIVLCIKGLGSQDVENVQTAIRQIHNGGEYLGVRDGVHKFLYVKYHEL